MSETTSLIRPKVYLGDAEDNAWIICARVKKVLPAGKYRAFAAEAGRDEVVWYSTLNTPPEMLVRVLKAAHKYCTVEERKAP